MLDCFSACLYACLTAGCSVSLLWACLHFMSACLFTLVSLFLSLPVCLSYSWLFSPVCQISCVFQSAYLHTCLGVCLWTCLLVHPPCLLVCLPPHLSVWALFCLFAGVLLAFLSNVPIASIGPLTFLSRVPIASIGPLSSCLECLLPVLVPLPSCLECLLPVLVHLPSCLECLLPALSTYLPV